MKAKLKIGMMVQFLQGHDVSTIGAYISWKNCTRKKTLSFHVPLVGLLVKCSSQYFKADSNSLRKVMLKGYVFLRLCGGNSKYTSTFRTATS